MHPINFYLTSLLVTLAVSSEASNIRFSSDFDNAIDQATKSVSKKQLEKYDDWVKNQSAT